MADGTDPTSLDITSDLHDGMPQGAQGDGQPVVPDGAQPAHGQDAKVVGTEPEKTTPEPSLREQLSSAFKDPEGKPTDQRQSMTADAPKLTRDGEGKYRLLDGTFASKEQIEAFEAAQRPAPEAPAAPGEQSVQTPADKYAPLLGGFTPFEQQQFTALPAELQEFLGRTMENVNVQRQRLAEYDLIEQQIIGPRRAAFAQNGSNPAIALNQLFALSDFAERDPGSFVLWYAEQRGLDIDALLDQRDQQGTVDPNVRQLQGTVQQLQNVVGQFQQNRQQQDLDARTAEVQAFALEKDGDNLKRPYLTEVYDTFAHHVGAVRSAHPAMSNAEVLQHAYEAACWSNPAVRQKMQQSSADTLKREQAAKVQAARAAGVSVATAAPASTSSIPNTPARTLREEIQAQFNAAAAA